MNLLKRGTQKSQASRDRKQNGGYLGLQEGEMEGYWWSLCAEFQFHNIEGVLERDGGDVCTANRAVHLKVVKMVRFYAMYIS